MLAQNILDQVNEYHHQGKKIVLASGVFDLLHQEHVSFLNKAKKCGDIFIVTIESDLRVRQMKGEGRPVHNQDERKAQVEALGVADFVIILPEEFSKPEHHRQLLQELRPAVLAVSSHTAHLEKKQALLKEFGGEVVIVHQHNPEISTTQLLAQSGQK